MEKIFILNGEEIKVQNYQCDAQSISFELGGKVYRFNLIDRKGTALILNDGTNFPVSVGSPNSNGDIIVMARGREALISSGGKKSRKGVAHAGGLVSPMPGKIFKVLKEEGTVVTKGEPILILEAMKMEHSIRADKDGRVKKIFFKTGELVQGGVTLVEVE